MGALTPTAFRDGRFSSSVAYMYPSLIFGIPPGRPYSSLEKLYFPFTVNVWICILLLFVASAIVIIALKFVSKDKRTFFVGQSNNMPFFNMVNISLGGAMSSNKLPFRNFARTLLMIWLISSLVLRNAYQGKLFDSLRGSQRNQPFFELNKLYESNLKLYLLDAFYVYISDLLGNQNHRYIS